MQKGKQVKSAELGNGVMTVLITSAKTHKRTCLGRLVFPPVVEQVHHVAAFWLLLRTHRNTTQLPGQNSALDWQVFFLLFLRLNVSLMVLAVIHLLKIHLEGGVSDSDRKHHVKEAASVG